MTVHKVEMARIGVARAGDRFRFPRAMQLIDRMPGPILLIPLLVSFAAGCKAPEPKADVMRQVIPASE